MNIRSMIVYPIDETSNITALVRTNDKVFEVSLALKSSSCYLHHQLHYLSSSKEKINFDQCILSADAQSSEGGRIGELHKEASLALRTCGWSEEVYAFMRSKKLEAQSDFQASDVNAMKKLLIADAKPMFISRIPEALKSSLIKRLTSFSQGTSPSST
ncbi:Ubiquitin carboxyl-terminal hydrolase 25 [Datura stramonium]|uniref:Ubiquitin carboxyl-terminal hydrolase 25 n=1 Tax=Datura stramonium TaxID=4076 RepID=A0ABS8RQ13_DATST|nr:Ubiquitin carboxyl-terminal hydrolase 25 [Datura stramonium]